MEELLNVAEHLTECIPITEKETQRRQRIREGIRHTREHIRSPFSDKKAGPTDAPRIILCTTCFRRDIQLLCAATINCALLWSRRARWIVLIATFAEDENTVAVLKARLAVPIEEGNVILISAGDAGIKHAQENAQDDEEQPRWMPRLPTDDKEPKADPNGRRRLKYWHSPKAKNTAHAAAVEYGGANAYILSTDCDQIIYPSFTTACVDRILSSGHKRGFMITRSNCKAPLSGRVLYSVRDFIMI